jgi:hypothetical protein
MFTSASFTRSDDPLDLACFDLYTILQRNFAAQSEKFQDAESYYVDQLL